MRLIHSIRPRPFPVADRSRDGELYADYHPRLRAVAHLRELLADGRAGLDPYDETVFLFDAKPNELVWAAAVVNLTGLQLDVIGRGDRRRYRLILEADVRQELGLDEPGAPVLADEPLASRRIDEAAIEAGLRLLADPKTPVLRAVADARAAQQRAHERSAS